MMDSPLTKAIALALLVGNDCWYIHLYAKGDKFDQLHKMTEEYYHWMSSQSDTLMEMGMEFGVMPNNPSLVLQSMPDYAPEVDVEYSWETALVVLKDKISLYISALQELREYTTFSDVQSTLDEWIRAWSKEVNYKLDRRSEDRSSMLNGFVNTGPPFSLYRNP